MSDDDNLGGTRLVTVLQTPTKFRGMPDQGFGFFKTFYTLFRGRGVVLSGSSGVFSSVRAFFTAQNVLYLGCDDPWTLHGYHIREAVTNPEVQSMMSVCLAGGEPSGELVQNWSEALSQALASPEGRKKRASAFRITFQAVKPGIERQARDLIIHAPHNRFSASREESSAQALDNFLNVVKTNTEELGFGGFYALVLPANYSGIDVMLSSIVATASATEMPLVYSGMLTFTPRLSDAEYEAREEGILTIWVFRFEPMNSGTFETLRATALERLRRYPPSIQQIVEARLPRSSANFSSATAQYGDVLTQLVTPTATLASLFRIMASSRHHDVLSALGSYQPKYAIAINRAKMLPDRKYQVRSILDLLYDLGVASGRN